MVVIYYLFFVHSLWIYNTVNNNIYCIYLQLHNKVFKMQIKVIPWNLFIASVKESSFETMHKMHDWIVYMILYRCILISVTFICLFFMFSSCFVLCFPALERERWIDEALGLRSRVDNKNDKMKIVNIFVQWKQRWKYIQIINIEITNI
jgi:hypothetical protein